MIKRLLVVIAWALCGIAQAQTPAQMATLRTAVLAEPTLAAAIQSADDYAIAAWLNADASPTWYVWRSTTDGDSVSDAITWSSLTPADTPDATAAYTNRALACQSRQINLQIMLQGKQTIASGRSNIRQGLSDALQSAPCGAGGAVLDAGWLGAGKVKAAITRVATRAEKLLSTGTGTIGTPAALGWEGLVTPGQASNMR